MGAELAECKRRSSDKTRAGVSGATQNNRGAGEDCGFNSAVENGARNFSCRPWGTGKAHDGRDHHPHG
jgi:hypothetical protein